MKLCQEGEGKEEEAGEGWGEKEFKCCKVRWANRPVHQNMYIH